MRSLCGLVLFWPSVWLVTGNLPATPQSRDMVYDYAYAFSADTRRPRSDYRRYGAENVRALLGFIGAQPGMDILELSPKDGFYTELLSVIVGDEGRIVARNSAALHRHYAEEMVARGHLARLNNITYEIRPYDRAWQTGWADRVTLLDRDISSLLDRRRSRLELEALLEKVRLVLKPGGQFIVIIRDVRQEADEARLGGETRRSQLVRLATGRDLSLVSSEVLHYPAETGAWTDVMLKFELSG